jgi:hypothetical protein
MTNYLIVVPRGNTELFDLLSVAFRGHTGFQVVIDRRGAGSPASAGTTGDMTERRGGRQSLGPDEIAVAERAERTDRSGTTSDTPRSFQRVPVRRRRVRSRAAAAREASSQARQAADSGAPPTTAW